MFFGLGVTVSSIHAAGVPGGGLSTLPKAEVVLIKTKLCKSCNVAAASRSTKVPVILVSMKSCCAWLSTCGLCSVAAWTTWEMLGLASMMDDTKVRSLMEPTWWVVCEGRMSMPRGVRPRVGRASMRAVPRWPAEPVTRTSKGGGVRGASILKVVDLGCMMSEGEGVGGWLKI